MSPRIGTFVTIIINQVIDLARHLELIIFRVSFGIKSQQAIKEIAGRKKRDMGLLRKTAPRDWRPKVNGSGSQPELTLLQFEASEIHIESGKFLFESLGAFFGHPGLPAEELLQARQGLEL